ncbi:hypothetical protein T459_23254 [Capsicum annuum]|uniref:ATP-dependent helicase C-terminal domain-containing protein n=1 Tax=Capsicum annuum TaxID=4072 RepID=A0A2G2YRV1_CAPAN|nr:hypothetical protein FXO37_32983 [Capsicum annuum]PHT72469.1 hypothetical protein T459_23254 [Capsicum annuum]
MLEDMENFGQLCDYGYYRRIKIEDVKTVIHRMHKTSTAKVKHKVSEGLDFTDNAGRAVVITYIPFSTSTDPKALVRVKIKSPMVLERIWEAATVELDAVALSMDGDVDMLGPPILNPERLGVDDVEGTYEELLMQNIVGRRWLELVGW